MELVAVDVPVGAILRVGRIEYRSGTLTGVVADETLMLRPFGPAIFQRFVEHEEERGEESCQESVEDDVEHQDQDCKNSANTTNKQKKRPSSHHQFGLLLLLWFDRNPSILVLSRRLSQTRRGMWHTRK